MFETRRSERCLDPLEGARQEFNKNRKIIISCSAPIRPTLDEAKEFLADFECTSIMIKKLRRVVATLKNATDVAKLNRKTFCGNKVDVRILPSNKLLCVAQLPFRMGERGFAELVNNYGEIERCFLMLTKNGTSKGYGLVEFTCNRQETEAIRCKLERKSVYDSVLHCDFIKETITDFEQLNSTCLYVGNLPSEFNDDEQLREAFHVVAEPLFCCVARENDLPLGFAVVEFDKPEQAEETFHRVQDSLIGGRMIDVKYCIPGHSVPEAFSRHLRFLSGRVGVEIIPSVLPVTDLCHPPPVCLALTGVLEKYSSVLKDFKRVIFHLQKHLNMELQQQMSMKPGILGEPPKVKSLLDNAGLQASLLAVMLGHQLRKSLPDDLTVSTISSMLPKDFNFQLICTSSRIAEATTLIQAMCTGSKIDNDDNDDDDTDDDANDDDDNEDDKNAKAPEASEIKKIEDEMENTSCKADKPETTPDPESLSSTSATPSEKSNANPFTDLDALLAIVQTSCRSNSKHPFVVQRKTAKSSDTRVQLADNHEATTAKVEHRVLSKSSVRKARRRLAALRPSAHQTNLKLLNEKAVNQLLGCAVMKLVQDRVFFTVPTKLAQTLETSVSQPPSNLTDVQINQPQLSRMVVPVSMGDGLMGPQPTAPTELSSVELGLEKPGTRITGDAPGKGILGSPPAELRGSVGHRQWDELERDKQVQIVPNFSYPGARGFGRGVRIDFGGGDFRCGNSNGNDDERFGFGGVRCWEGSSNEKFSSCAGKIVDSCVPNAAAVRVGLGGNCNNGVKFFRGGRCIQGFGRGWNGPNGMPWKSGNQWRGNDYCDGQKHMRIQGIDSWNGGRSGEVDQMRWNGGMENLRGDNPFQYQDFDFEHERMALGRRGGGGGRGGRGGRGGGIGLNEFANGGSWTCPQQGYYVHGPMQCPLPLAGVATTSFEMQAGSQVYESYYTGSRSSRGHEQPKSANVFNRENLGASIGSCASDDYRMERYSCASRTVPSSLASSEFSGRGRHSQDLGTWQRSQGCLRQGQRQYGLKQGQYGLSEEQHGRCTQKRPLQEDLCNFQFSQLHGSIAKKNRPSYNSGI